MVACLSVLKIASCELLSSVADGFKVGNVFRSSEFKHQEDCGDIGFRGRIHSDHFPAQTEGQQLV